MEVESILLEERVNQRMKMEQNVKLVAITEGVEELIGKSAQDIISYV